MSDAQEVWRLYGLGMNVQHLTGLTSWVWPDPPPAVGWWEVRMRGTEGNGSRRWWNVVRWSVPVLPGFHDHHDASVLMVTESRYANRTFEWRGIAMPPVEHFLARGAQEALL